MDFSTRISYYNIGGLPFYPHSIMESKSYFELLRDPRWQKKRLKIMERDGFMCISCQSDTETLNVHHAVQYRKNIKPWEYEDDELITLCEKCHKEISEIIDNCMNIIIGRCWGIDSATELYKIIMELDGMNPYELNRTWKILATIRNPNYVQAIH